MEISPSVWEMSIIAGGVMAANVSMAVWCVGQQSAANSSMEAHFNYWRLSGERTSTNKRAENDFVEVGVMLESPQLVETVNIYIPANLNIKSVSDCSKYFKNTAICQGIFNMPLRSIAPDVGGPRCIELQHATTNEPFCRVHTFVLDGERIHSSELTITSENEGTLFKISESAVRDTCVDESRPPVPVYFRLRFIIPPSNPFIQTIETPERFFQSGFEEIEYVDFRLNEARTLPDAVERMMKHGRNGSGQVKLTTVAFLTAIPIRSQLSTSSAQFHKFRILENHIWNNYVQEGIPSGMLVYHWKKNDVSEILDFSAFVRIQTRRTGFKILAVYLAIAFLFGVVGNLTASGLQYMLSSSQDTQRHVEESNAQSPRRSAAPTEGAGDAKQ